MFADSEAPMMMPPLTTGIIENDVMSERANDRLEVLSARSRGRLSKQS